MSDRRGLRTKCLPKRNGFACQRESDVFEFCSEEKNFACGKGLVCAEDKFCVPKS